jgi:hypothetical protein
MNKLAEAKLYANAAYLRNKETICRCFECQQKEAEETLAAVQRIIAARTPQQEAKVIQIERRRGR